MKNGARVIKRDPDTGLTVLQETFCQALARGLSQSEAYREAYPNSTEWRPKSVHEKASVLAANGKVRSRVAVLQADLRARSAYTLDVAMIASGEALALAREKRDPKAMVAAISLRARMNGLLVEDRLNDRVPLSDLSDEQLDEKLRHVLQELQSMGAGAGLSFLAAENPAPVIRSLEGSDRPATKLVELVTQRQYGI